MARAEDNMTDGSSSEHDEASLQEVLEEPEPITKKKKDRTFKHVKSLKLPTIEEVRIKAFSSLSFLFSLFIYI